MHGRGTWVLAACSSEERSFEDLGWRQTGVLHVTHQRAGTGSAACGACFGTMELDCGALPSWRATSVCWEKPTPALRVPPAPLGARAGKQDGFLDDVGFMFLLRLSIQLSDGPLTLLF